MTVAQIIVMGVLGLLWVWSWYHAIKGDYSAKMANLALFVFIFFIAIIVMVQRNEIAKGCPEYEKIENVYKLKS